MGLSSSSPWLKYYGKTPASLDYPHATMYQMVADAARRKPGHVAYTFMGKKITYTEFMQRIEAAAEEETVEVTVTQQIVHNLGWKGKLLFGAVLLFLLLLFILALLRRKKKKDDPEEAKGRGRTDENVPQSTDGTDRGASSAASPRDGTDCRS